MPDLDLHGNSSINVEYTPIIFAPLVAYDESNKEESELSILDKDCHCDKERAGFGNACALQESIELPGGLKSPKNPGSPQTVSAFLIFFVVNGIVLQFQLVCPHHKTWI